jgi:mono/diheme cytochrome c family protein
MISARMSRPIKVLLLSGATIGVAATIAACGTEHIGVPSASPDHAGAVLFATHCSGCHTLSFAATHGSASNVRSREVTNGPNFNVRCERPVTRVLYAVENGGFSGAIMPPNVVVGQEAREVAQFVADYAGRQATNAPGVTPCAQQAIGTLPAPGAAGTTTTTPAPTTATTTPAPAKPAAAKGKKGANGKKGAKPAPPKH